MWTSAQSSSVASLSLHHSYVAQQTDNFSSLHLPPAEGSVVSSIVAASPNHYLDLALASSASSSSTSASLDPLLLALHQRSLKAALCAQQRSRLIAARRNRSARTLLVAGLCPELRRRRCTAASATDRRPLNLSRSTETKSALPLAAAAAAAAAAAVRQT